MTCVQCSNSVNVPYRGVEDDDNYDCKWWYGYVTEADKTGA